MLAEDAGEVQVAWLNRQTQFLVRFTARAGVRRFAIVGMQFATRRTPEATIRLLRALEQQHFVAFIEATKQRGDSVGQRHVGSEAGARRPCKKAAQNSIAASDGL